MFLIISVSILSLVLSIISLAKENHAGRYQVFYHENLITYIIDTKTSQLFMRCMGPEKTMCYNLGTLEKPYSIFDASGQLKQ